MNNKHWTLRKPSPPTIAAQVLRVEDWDKRMELRDIAINTLLREHQNAKSEGHKRFIISQLDRLGHDRDYSPADEGMHWSDNPR